MLASLIFFQKIKPPQAITRPSAAAYKLKEPNRFSLKQFYLIVEPDKVQRLPTKWNENPDGLFSGLKQKKIALS